MKMSLAALAAVVAASAPAVAAAAVYPGNVEPIALGVGGYTQNFDTLARSGTSGTALPAGWQISEDGQNGNTAYGVGTGSNTAGNVYSFGAATGATNSDRALGSLTSGNLSPAAFGAIFVNAFDAAINTLTISYDGEQWRRGSADNDRLVFQYILNPTSIGSGTWTTVDALGFATPNRLVTDTALNGNLADNRTAISGTITGLSIAAGDSVAFRWRDLNVDFNDDGLAIDNFSVTAATVAAVPEPATWAMMFVGFGMIGAIARYRGRSTKAIVA